MTGASPSRPSLPPRLVEGNGPTAELLRRELRAGAPLEEAASWDRLLRRLGRAHAGRRAPVLLALGAGAVAGVLGLLVVARAPARAPRAAGAGRAATAPGGGGPAARALAAPVAPTAPLPPARVSLAAAPVTLPQAATVELIDQVAELRSRVEARATASADAAALAFATDDGAVVQLFAGRVDLAIEKQAAGRRFRVVAGPYQFTALGTVFHVARDGAGTRLDVDEGRVAVDKGARRIAVVAGGQSWQDPRAGGAAVPRAPAVAGAPVVAAPTAPESPPAAEPGAPAAAGGPSAPAPVPARAPPPAAPATTAAAAPAPTTAACTARARQDARDGVACFLARADAGGGDAQIALYEVARLRRDRLDDDAGALGALLEQRRRFPAGALRAEVDLSIVELLPKLRRYREALDESAALLQRGEHAGDLRLLRGNIYREALGDFASAEAEYARAAEAGGRAAEAAGFWRAVCLETLGRRAEAAAAYRAYLDGAHPGAAHADEARRRLRAMDGEREHSPPGSL